MATRLTRLLLLAMIGISTIISHCCALNYTIQYNVAEKFNHDVGVYRNDAVNLCCPMECSRLRLAFWGGSKYLLDLKDGCHVIGSFDGTKAGNYQCECVTEEYIRWNSVSLSLDDEVTVTPDVSKSFDRVYKQNKAAVSYFFPPRDQLLKFGSFENHLLAIDDHSRSEVRTVNRSSRLSSDPTMIKIPTKGKIKLTCGIEPKIGMNIFWVVAMPENSNFSWYEINEYKQSRVGLDELIATSENTYKCFFDNGGSSDWRRFDVKESGPFPFDKAIEAGPAKNHTGSMQSHMEFECGIDTEPYTYVMWVKTAENVSELEAEVTDQNIIQHSDVDDPSVYHISELSQEDEGYYTCYVMNATIALYRSHHLRVTEAEQTSTTGIIAGVLCGVTICILAYGVFVVRKSRKQVRSSMKQIVDVATHRKRIVEIERPSGSDGVRAGRPQLTLPIVRIRTEQIIVDKKADAAAEVIPSYEIPLDTPWELRRENLSNIQTLDVGSSGRIMTARLANYIPGGPIEVMIKTLCGNPANDDVRALVSEMETMKAIGSHVNIVSLLGACTQNGPLYVVMEFAKHGSLKSFLQQQTASAGYTSIRESGEIENKLPSDKDLVSYARQVANGMQYLASRGCIHRDLAARNVLVCEGNLLKITDYAVMGEDRTDERPDRGKYEILSVRWMAPETLFNNYCTIKANVWSYGILLWEIMTFADTPYPMFTSNMELLKQLRRGYRMESPKNCPNEIYQLMLRCWSENSARRPMFEEIVDDLNRMLETSETQRYQNLCDELSNNQVNEDDYCDVVRSSLYGTVLLSDSSRIMDFGICGKKSE